MNVAGRIFGHQQLVHHLRQFAHTAVRAGQIRRQQQDAVENLLAQPLVRLCNSTGNHLMNLFVGQRRRLYGKPRHDFLP